MSLATGHSCQVERMRGEREKKRKIGREERGERKAFILTVCDVIAVE